MENKQNFYLRNENVVSLLEGKNKTEFITRALKFASLNYREFIEFTRKMLNPKSAQPVNDRFSDLFLQNKIKNNTIFSGEGISVFAAKGATAYREFSKLEIDGITLSLSHQNVNITYTQMENDFNDDDFCVEVSMEGLQ